MPKLSLRYKDAEEANPNSLSFKEGWGLITAAKCAIHQFPPSKKTGTQADEGCKVILTIQRTDSNGKPDGSEPVEEYLNAANKKDGVIPTWPGLAKSRDDQNPKNLGAEMGTEGNCFQGKIPHPQSKFMVFSQSLEQRGFKPEVLNEGYLPDLVGTVAEFTTESRQVNGSSYPQLLVKNIKVYGYETQKAASGAKSAPTPTNGTAKSAAKSVDPGDVALELLQEIIAANPGVEVAYTKMPTKAFRYLAANKSEKPTKEEARKLLGDREWLEGHAEDLGLEIGDETVTFPG